jgi:Domain of unknown function (DUF4328)
VKGDPYARYARWEPLTPLARSVIAALVLSAALAALELVALAVAPAPVSVSGTMDVIAPRLQEQLATGLGSGLGSLVSLAQLATGVLWLVWQHRAQSDLYARRVPGLRYTPGWAVGWWFVPFANLVMPLVCMRELFGATATGSGQRVRRDWRLPAWWGLYLCGIVALVGFVPLFADFFRSAVSQSATSDPRQIVVTISADAIRRARVWSGIGQATRIAAAGFAAWIVWTISTREDAGLGSVVRSAGGATDAGSFGDPSLPPPPPPRPDL